MFVDHPNFRSYPPVPLAKRTYVISLSLFISMVLWLAVIWNSTRQDVVLPVNSDQRIGWTGNY